MQKYKSTATGNIYEVEQLPQGLVDVTLRCEDPDLNGHNMIMDKHALTCLKLEEIKP